jgi:hypothetical protein
VLSQAVEAAIMGNVALDAEDRIAPRLTYENHLKIVRGMWEQRPTQLFVYVACPTLIIPAELPPADQRAAAWIDRKRRAVAVAEAAIPHARVGWAHDTFPVDQAASNRRDLLALQPPSIDTPNRCAKMLTRAPDLHSLRAA